MFWYYWRHLALDQALTLVFARKATIIILVSQWHEIDFTMWNSQIHGHGVLGAAGSIWGPRANEESSLGTHVWKYKSTSYSYNCSPNEWRNTQQLFYLLSPWVRRHSKINFVPQLTKILIVFFACKHKCQSLVSHLTVPIFKNFYLAIQKDDITIHFMLFAIMRCLLSSLGYPEKQSVCTGGPHILWFQNL